MDAKGKLQSLSYSWYGYTVCATLGSIFGLRASGLFSLVVGFTLWAMLNAVSLVIGIALVTWVSRSLILGHSALMRRFLIVLSFLGVVLGGLGTLSLAGAFLRFWQLGLLVQLGFTVSWALLNLRSLRTLTETQVKAYFV